MAEELNAFLKFLFFVQIILWTTIGLYNFTVDFMIYLNANHIIMDVLSKMTIFIYWSMSVYIYCNYIDKMVLISEEKIE